MQAHHNTQYSQPAMIPAGFWLRAIALTIDVLVVTMLELAVYLAMSIIMIPLMVLNSASNEMASILGAILGFLSWPVSIAISWLYFAIQECSSTQATLGKRALGLRVTDRHGNRLTFARASGRHFARILSNLTLFLGYAMAGFTRNKQALHDIVADTLVMKVVEMPTAYGQQSFGQAYPGPTYAQAQPVCSQQHTDPVFANTQTHL